jgi:hypothetical protein
MAATGETHGRCQAKLGGVAGFTDGFTGDVHPPNVFTRLLTNAGGNKTQYPAV